MFSIVWEKPDLIVLKLSGFWKDDTMAAFREAMKGNLPTRGKPHSFDVLADFLDYPPQSATVVQAQEKVIEDIQAAGMRRGANVIGSALMRRQVERVNLQPNSRYFTSLAEARRWLAEPFIG